MNILVTAFSGIILTIHKAKKGFSSGHKLSYVTLMMPCCIQVKMEFVGFLIGRKPEVSGEHKFLVSKETVVLHPWESET